MAQLPFTFRKQPKQPQAEGESTKPLSVSRLNALLRSRVETGFRQVFVEGELRGVRVHPRSGHAYFELADRRATVAVFMAEGLVRQCGFPLKDGLRALVWGDASVFEPRGRLQLRVARLEPVGEGALQLAFQAAAKRLEAAGLFAAERKRALPTLPNRVGVVTSKAGAALRDVIKTSIRRDPQVRLLVAPASVQGVGAVQGLIRQLDRIQSRCDVVLLVRGGGSLEDLRAFNEEAVARKVAALRVPVVTGIGHESDLTLVDLVADARASTPTAAAELAVAVRAELKRTLIEFEARLTRAARSNLSFKERTLRFLALPQPSARLRQCAQWLDSLERAAWTSVERHTSHHRRRLESSDRALRGNHPATKLVHARHRIGALQARSKALLELAARRARSELDPYEARLGRSLTTRLEAARTQLAHLGHRLSSASPLAVLNRGYALVTNRSGTAVTDAQQLKSGDGLRLRFAKGSVWAVVADEEPS